MRPDEEEDSRVAGIAPDEEEAIALIHTNSPYSTASEFFQAQ